MKRAIVNGVAVVLTLPSQGSASEGSGGGINTTVETTATLGEIVPIVHPANDPAYVAEFAANHSALAYNTEPSGAADIPSTITFSPALPTGSPLIALDQDQTVETFTLLSGGDPLTPLAQVKSRADQSSIFLSWNSPSGELDAQTSAPVLNDNEASIFDISRLSAVTVDFRNGGPASGSGIAIALPVPEPSTPALAAIALVVAARLGHAMKHTALALQFNSRRGSHFYAKSAQHLNGLTGHRSPSRWDYGSREAVSFSPASRNLPVVCSTGNASWPSRYPNYSCPNIVSIAERR